MMLEVKNLTVGLKDKNKTILVKDVSFTIQEGEVFALVGESGSGKSVSANTILGFVPPPLGKIISGEIYFNGKSLLGNKDEDWRQIRGNVISMIFQEPMVALNPIYKIKKQLMEIFDYHEYDGDPEERIHVLMNRVGFHELDRVLNSFPHELSGGMLQRVVIVMALLLEPELIIADEPTTALDVTIQKQIMELLMELKDEEKVSILFITHNLALVSEYADSLGVMRYGEIVEKNSVREFFKNPQTDYAKHLLDVIPKL